MLMDIMNDDSKGLDPTFLSNDLVSEAEMLSIAKTLVNSKSFISKDTPDIDWEESKKKGMALFC